MRAACHWSGRLIGLLGLVGLASCAAPAAKSRCELWVDAYRGEPILYADILDDLAESQVIYLGERHTIPRHHAIQADIVRDLAGRGVPLVVGLEMLEWNQQPALDEYNRGTIGFDELAKRTDWAKRWSNYEQYRPVIEAAHAAGAPVLALNAKAETVRKVARQGLAGLDAESRAELPADLLLDDPPYEAYMRQVMMVHAMVDESMLRRMFEAQVSRDETMAARLCAFLASEAGQGRTAVVLCGAGHAERAMGIPTRVRERMPEVRDRILVFSESGDVELSAREQAMTREITITHEQLRVLDRPIADYLHVVGLRDGHD